MTRLPARYQLPLVAGVSLLVVVLVVGAILLAGQIRPEPTASVQPSSPSPSATADPSTPEGVVRAFFAALKEARRTDDPALISPYVAGEESSAYLSVQGFLLGQKEVNKASVLTVQQVENVSVQATGDTATVHLVYTEGGYDISLDTGEPLESPNVLAPRDVTMELRRVDGRWLVESYEALAQ